jgi:hypothetical protein
MPQRPQLNKKAVGETLLRRENRFFSQWLLVFVQLTENILITLLFPLSFSTPSKKGCRFETASSILKSITQFHHRHYLRITIFLDANCLPSITNA